MDEFEADVREPQQLLNVDNHPHHVVVPPEYVQMPTGEVKLTEDAVKKRAVVDAFKVCLFSCRETRNDIENNV